ncbi:MAG: hypothetical protein HRU15_13095 [Planctomycetes bacterium]|nr:hypothetical protein [Planctomycetota bacterium]
MINGTLVNEQGATGIRFDFSAQMPGGEVGVFFKDKQLILSVGEGVAELILKDSQGEATELLQDAEIVTRAHSLLPAKKSVLWQVQNANAILKNAMTVFRQQIEPLVLTEPDMAILLDFLPQASEVDGMFGIQVGEAGVNENGIHQQSVLELGLK